MQLESKVDLHNENNWLKVLTRNSHRVTHPLRNILFMIFLGFNGEDFFINNNQDNRQILYPCLNPVAEHYRERVIKDVIITADYKTRKPVGTFKFDCGFIYSRKMDLSDSYCIGTVKEFGHVWMGKLRKLMNNGQLTVKDISRRMGCDPNTVRKYSSKLKQDTIDNSELHKFKEIVLEDSFSNRVNYAIRISTYTKKNPDASRTDIRNRFQKEYMWLYRNDKERLNEILPRKKDAYRCKSRRVDWDKRDQEIYFEIKKAYKKIKDVNWKTRVTKTLLGKRSEYLSTIEKSLDKLPLTKQFIDTVTETVEQYQIRRVKYITDSMKEQGEDLVEWKIIRKVGLRKPYNKIVLKKIDEIIVDKVSF